MKNNQRINCDVNSCEYNDEDNNCNLDCIQVSCSCHNDNCTHKKETICDSFKTRES